MYKIFFLWILIFSAGSQYSGEDGKISLETDDYILMEVNDPLNPVYYMQKIPVPEENHPAVFCSFEQPKMNFKYFEKIFDQTDPQLFTDEDQLIMIDDKLYVLLSSGILQVFNVTISQDTDQIFFNHYNEVFVREANLLKAMNGPFYISLIYVPEIHRILIVLEEEFLLVDIDDKDKTTWMKYNKTSFNVTNAPLNKAIFLDGSLYLLRNKSYIEQYEIISSLEIKKKMSISLYKELSFLLNSSSIEEPPQIVDFSLNQRYFAILEKTSKQVFWVKRGKNLVSDDFKKENIKNISLSETPLKVYLTNNKLFVMVNGTINMEYFLFEFLLFQNGLSDYNDVYHIDYDYIDLFISDFYLFYSYEDYTILVPHAFEYPKSLNKRLKVTLNIEKVREIQPLKVSKEFVDVKKKNYFTAAVGNHIGVIETFLDPGKIVCKTNKFTPLGEYTLNMRLYQLFCKNLAGEGDKCDFTKFSTKDVFYNFTIVSSEKPNNKKIPAISFEIFVGLSIGLTVTLLILCFCLLYVRKIKRSYIRIEDTQKVGQHNRVMSKEELDTIEINKSIR